jgi:MOSC domain-containing protein YiiM
MNGTIREIHIRPAAGAPTQQLTEAQLVAGVGIVGDRYAQKAEALAALQKTKPENEVTLIESEEIDAFNAQTLFGHPYAAFRRNLVTRGIRLNALEGKEFTIGEVRLRGIELCEPCATLGRQLGKEVIYQMVHKCGLRAQILQSGTIHPGDSITPLA